MTSELFLTDPWKTTIGACHFNRTARRLAERSLNLTIYSILTPQCWLGPPVHQTWMSLRTVGGTSIWYDRWFTLSTELLMGKTSFILHTKANRFYAKAYQNCTNETDAKLSISWRKVCVKCQTYVILKYWRASKVVLYYVSRAAITRQRYRSPVHWLLKRSADEVSIHLIME